MYGQQVPEPEAIYRTKWYNDALTLGAYHSIRANVTTDDLNNLSRAVNNYLLFAGCFTYS